ncbi:Crp/Fnr family transcriptional regulator [Bacillus sp. 1NLA3E]|uniref:Crp/Fnr family transcriptional regulator n=1 Tax=Bacillus sp. 1NLA3E TaxID=666686 RepID=UPI000247E546|nr:Crp/Fnr family transcriptional regulator [Bacillus sp. 1NLA3E]AGK52711.1 Crp/Fnr family transcriptional regulator [Bacillus sp. 1NLA3E]
MQTILDMSAGLTELFQSIHHIQRMEKGSLLFQEDSFTNELYIVQSGLVQVSKVIPDGRELTLRMCSKGDLVGELALFNSTQRYLLNGKVIEQGEVAVISKDQLEENLSKNHNLALEFIKWMSLQHQKTQTKFRDLILHGKKGAMYSTLIRLANTYGNKNSDGITINIPLTNQELANFCATSREVVNRLLSELRKNRIISVEKGLITIFDLNYLKGEIDCENCPIEICNIS